MPGPSSDTLTSKRDSTTRDYSTCRPPSGRAAESATRRWTESYRRWKEHLSFRIGRQGVSNKIRLLPPAAHRPDA